MRLVTCASHQPPPGRSNDQKNWVGMAGCMSALSDSRSLRGGVVINPNLCARWNILFHGTDEVSQSPVAQRWLRALRRLDFGFEFRNAQTVRNKCLKEVRSIRDSRTSTVG